MSKHKPNKLVIKEKDEKEYKDLVIVNGTITEAHANAMFSVELDNGVEVKLPISGKIRKFKIKITPGDRVQVGLNTYDLSKGRILFRLKKEE